MALLNEFPEYLKSISISRRTNSVTNGVVSPGDYTLVASPNGLYWEPSSSIAFRSDRFTDTTIAIIVVPVGTDVAKGDKVTVAGKSYKALDPISPADDEIEVSLELFS